MSLGSVGWNFGILLIHISLVKTIIFVLVQISTHLVILIEILIILVKLINVLVLVIVLVGQGFTGKVVDGTWDDLLLEVLTELVISLETGVELFKLILVDFVGLESLGCGWLRGREKVEEGFSGDFFSDRSGLAGGFQVLAHRRTERNAVWRMGNPLLLRCFLISTFLVRSLPLFHLISCPTARS